MDNNSSRSTQMGRNKLQARKEREFEGSDMTQDVSHKATKSNIVKQVDKIHQSTDTVQVIKNPNLRVLVSSLKS